MEEEKGNDSRDEVEEEELGPMVGL